MNRWIDDFNSRLMELAADYMLLLSTIFLAIIFLCFIIMCIIKIIGE
jgi:hypothetical protein